MADEGGGDPGPAHDPGSEPGPQETVDTGQSIPDLADSDDTNGHTKDSSDEQEIQDLENNGILSESAEAPVNFDDDNFIEAIEQELKAELQFERMDSPEDHADLDCEKVEDIAMKKESDSCDDVEQSGNDLQTQHMDNKESVSETHILGSMQPSESGSQTKSSSNLTESIIIAEMSQNRQALGSIQHDLLSTIDQTSTFLDSDPPSTVESTTSEDQDGIPLSLDMPHSPSPSPVQLNTTSTSPQLEEQKHSTNGDSDVPVAVSLDSSSLSALSEGELPNGLLNILSQSVEYKELKAKLDSLQKVSLQQQDEIKR